MMLPDEFRVNHRAASESLLRAAAEDSDSDLVTHELDKATYFENEAMQHITTRRQRAPLSRLYLLIKRRKLE